MHGWGLTTGDHGHIDVDDAANLDPEHPLLRPSTDHPALADYYARIIAEAMEPAEPDDPDELRRRANLDWAATAAHEPNRRGAPYGQRESLSMVRYLSNTVQTWSGRRECCHQSFSELAGGSDQS